MTRPLATVIEAVGNVGRGSVDEASAHIIGMRMINRDLLRR